MAFREEWEKSTTERTWSMAQTGMGALRVTLLFGSAAVALALILTPIIENQADRMVMSTYSPGVDMMATGTVTRGDLDPRASGIGQQDSGSYVVRRSVLQPSPSSVCIIRQNGMRTGDC